MKKTPMAFAVCAAFFNTFSSFAAVPRPWAQSDIEFAKQAGITSFTQFNKSYTAPLNRSELCTLIVETLESSGEKELSFTEDNPFSDTDSGDILTAYSLGIVNGTGDGLFMPEKEVTRQEAAKIFSNTLDIIEGSGKKSKITDNTAKYNDSEKIAPWAHEYVARMTRREIFKGDDLGNFNPLSGITMEQGVVLCSRILKISDENTPNSEINITDADLKIKTEVSNGSAHISWNGKGDFKITVAEKRKSYYENDFNANITEYETDSPSLDITVYPNKHYTVTVTDSNAKRDSASFETPNFSVNYEHREAVKEAVSSFSSDEQAAAEMQTITVNVWQLSNGEKYASTMQITVYKEIADKVKAVFDEIFAGDEKFPIYSLGAYAWRAPMASGRYSEHNLGTAIDINPDHNHCIYSDGSTVGQYYLPYENPYSITPYGDVVRAFEKHGFTWGGDAWKSPKDYMHFSYLGT